MGLRNKINQNKKRFDSPEDQALSDTISQARARPIQDAGKAMGLPSEAGVITEQSKTAIRAGEEAKRGSEKAAGEGIFDMEQKAERTGDPTFEAKVADLRKEYDEAMERKQWGQVAEKVGHALTKLGAAYHGLRTGVDLSGVEFDKTDWESQYDRELEKYKTDVKAAEKTFNVGRVSGTRRVDRLPNYLGENDEPVVLVSDPGKPPRIVGAASGKVYTDQDTGLQKIKRGSEYVSWTDAQGRVWQKHLPTGDLKELTKKGKAPPEKETEETITSLNEISGKKVRSRVEKAKDTYNKDQKELNDTEAQLINLETLVDENPAGAAGIIDTLIARNVAMERGALAEGDVNRANVLKGLGDRFGQIQEDLLGEGEMTPEKRKRVQDLVRTSQISLLKSRELRDNFHANQVVTELRGAHPINKQGAIQILSGKKMRDYSAELEKLSEDSPGRRRKGAQLREIGKTLKKTKGEIVPEDSEVQIKYIKGTPYRKVKGGWQKVKK